MKKLSLSLISLILFCSINFAQTPLAINYQGVARDASGNILINQPIRLRLSIITGSAWGAAVYIETHSRTTDEYGLFSLQIGQGSVQYGTFSTINWSTNSNYLKIEIDPTGGTNYSLLGTNQFASVPYALHAKTAENGFSGNYNDLTNKPILFDGTWLSLTGKPTTVNGFGITDAMTTAHTANGITQSNITNWNTAFAWGNHAGLYRPISYVPTWGEITANPFAFSAVANNQLLKYNTTSGKWENWTPNYLTSFTETDPSWTTASPNYYTKSNLQTNGEAALHFNNLTNKPNTLLGYGITDAMNTSHAANTISTTNITNWNTTFAWGNHAGLYRPISYVPAWGEITANPFAFSAVANNQLLKYNSGTSKWENWSPNYLTSFTETDPIFGAWDKSSGILIVSAQVSDFATSVTNTPAVLANSAKISYPPADAAKLAGIAAGAEVNVNSDWNATSGDAQIFNKPVGTTPGDMLYWNGTQWLPIPAGTNGQVLKFNNSVPTWASSISLAQVQTNETVAKNDNSAIGGGNISDGGSLVTARGVCWSTLPNPTIADSKTIDGNGSGSYTSQITGLTTSTTYHIRAYATNSMGTSYGNDLSFTNTWVCGSNSLTINHVTTGGVAPVNKATTYGTVTNMAGEPTKCWITSNLGSTNQATVEDDASEAAAGWYFQFNRKQGFKHDGTTRTPATTWISSISENSDWLAVNDPCALELGYGWRMPTSTEWTNIKNGCSANFITPWNSGLKLHKAGGMYNNNGELLNRGLGGHYWSTSQNNDNSGWFLSSNPPSISQNNKNSATSVRCLKE